MKLLTGLIAIYAFGTFAQAEYPLNYNCIPQYDNYYYDIKITVFSSDRFVINDKDDGYKDESYKPTPKNKDFIRIIGDLESIGDGIEGYRVDLLVNQYILNGSDIGYMKYRADGPHGFYDEVLKCEKL